MEQAPASNTPQQEADALFSLYDPLFLALHAESERADWVASTDVSEEHTGARTGAATAFSAFAAVLKGSASVPKPNLVKAKST